MQNQVGQFFAPGIPGGEYSLEPSRHTTYLSGGDCVVGNFVWRTEDNTVIPTSTGSILGAGSAPLGLARLTKTGHNMDFTAEASMIVPEGQNCEVDVQAEAWVIAPAGTTAAVGQKVFAVEATGAIAFGAAGGTVAGAVETGYTVIVPGAENELVAISQWRNQ